MIACFYFERGARVQLLEQLFGSTTLMATINTNFMLRSFNLVAVFLVFFWALSPIGGQGTLRLVSVQNRGTTHGAPIFYVNTSEASVMKQHTGYHITSAMAVYVSSIIAPNSTQMSPRDTWGNVKIPLIQGLGREDTSGWISVPNGNVTYSSLVGIPIANLATHGNSSFVLSSSYFTLNCATGPKLIPKDDEIVWSGWLNDTAVVKKTGQLVRGIGFQRYSRWSGSMMTTWSVGSFVPKDIRQDPPNLFFQFASGHSMNLESLTTLNCTVINNPVDSKVECNGPACRVVAMRTTPGSSKSYSFQEFRYNHCADFYGYFTTATGYIETLSKYYTSSLTEQYAYYGYSPVGAPNATFIRTLFDIDGAHLADRLGRLLNSFWIPTLEPTVVTGVYPSLTELNHVTTSTSYIDGVEVKTSQTGAQQEGLSMTTNATVTSLDVIFVCHFESFIMLMVSSFSLLIVVIVGVSLKYFGTSTPRIVGHVGSLTRDNQYVSSLVPVGGSMLDGYQRARLLKDVQIKLGDSRATDPAAGYIAVLPADRSHAKLSSRRKYW